MTSCQNLLQFFLSARCGDLALESFGNGIGFEVQMFFEDGDRAI